MLLMSHFDGILTDFCDISNK